jgi:hypothetical protein
MREYRLTVWGEKVIHEVLERKKHWSTDLKVYIGIYIDEKGKKEAEWEDKGMMSYLWNEFIFAHICTGASYRLFERSLPHRALTWHLEGWKEEREGRRVRDRAWSKKMCVLKIK